jgi:hypothetical protein
MPFTFNPFTGTFDYYQSSSGGSGGVLNYKVRRTITPSPDGATTVFTTPDNFATSTLTVYLNGLEEHYISETSANTFTFATAPLTGDIIDVSYVVQSTASLYGSALYGTGTYS